MAKHKTPVEKLVSASTSDREINCLLADKDCRAMGSFFLVADAAPAFEALNDLGLRPIGDDSYNIRVCIFADFGMRRILELALFEWVKAVFISRVT